MSGVCVLAVYWGVGLLVIPTLSLFAAFTSSLERYDDKKDTKQSNNGASRSSALTVWPGSSAVRARLWSAGDGDGCPFYLEGKEGCRSRLVGTKHNGFLGGKGKHINIIPGTLRRVPGEPGTVRDNNSVKKRFMCLAYSVGAPIVVPCTQLKDTWG